MWEPFGKLDTYYQEFEKRTDAEKIEWGNYERNKKEIGEIAEKMWDAFDKDDHFTSGTYGGKIQAILEKAPEEVEDDDCKPPKRD